ncbi:ABC transporter permease [Sunxiuqinia sp. A32]|uniref:ABC transporter permease n=1 Tax=Sunxiuqinia sp. A32 TaxID=3461496 RepID=UPI004045E96A
MNTNLKLAWRNIWRNRRRTAITIASIFFGVLLSTFMTSMQEGTYSKMIDNVVGLYSGYIQIHHPEYWEEKTIDHTFTPTDSIDMAINQLPAVKSTVPRLESFALMSFEENTKGAAVIGIDPTKENQMTNLSNWIVEGSYLESNDNGILLAVNLAKNLGVTVNDTLVLLSQGYHGASAAGLFPVRGILKFPSPTMNNLGGYIELKTSQDFYSVPDRLTSLVIMLDEYDNVNQTKRQLESQLSSNYKVMTWDEMDPLTKNMIDADRSGAYLTKGILYALVGFGIFGTIIMMMAERRKEMGILVAIGMQKSQLSKILFFETILIGFAGVFVGFVISFPLIQYLVYHPIPLTGETGKVYEEFGFEPAMYFSSQWFVFGRQLLIIFILTLLVYIYPLVRTTKLKLTKALRA